MLVRCNQWTFLDSGRAVYRETQGSACGQASNNSLDSSYEHFTLTAQRDWEKWKSVPKMSLNPLWFTDMVIYWTPRAIVSSRRWAPQPKMDASIVPTIYSGCSIDNPSHIVLTTVGNSGPTQHFWFLKPKSAYSKSSESLPREFWGDILAKKQLLLQYTCRITSSWSL